MLFSCYTNLICSRRSLAPTHYPLRINELLLYGAHIHIVDPKLRCCYCCTYFLAHAVAAYTCCTSLSASIFPTFVGHEYSSLRFDYSRGVAHLSSPPKTPMTVPPCRLEVVQTQSRSSSTRHARGCLIAARKRPRAGSKQMATYQAVVAQTQSSSSSSNLCRLVATQTWSAHVARSRTKQ